LSRYARITELIERDRCVVLDGGTATELAEVVGDRPDLQERLWGTGALVRSPDDVLRVHRRYVDTGCDVISTDTWGLPTALRDERPQLWDADRPVHWMDVARRGIELARQAAAEGGRGDECAVAFSMNGDVDTPEGAETIRLLARVFEDVHFVVEVLGQLEPEVVARIGQADAPAVHACGRAALRDVGDADPAGQVERVVGCDHHRNSPGNCGGM